MKKLSIIALFVCGTVTIANAQNTAKIPAADVKTIDGKIINTANLSNNGKPMIISFWATWCKPCKKELDAIT